MSDQLAAQQSNTQAIEISEFESATRRINTHRDTNCIEASSLDLVYI